MRSRRLPTAVVLVVGLLSLAVAGVGPGAVLAADSLPVTTTDTGKIVVSVTDSTNGNDTATVPVTVRNTSIPSDAVYESGTAAAEYDTNTDGRISISELGGAGAAYAQGTLSIAELGNVGAAYARS